MHTNILKTTISPIVYHRWNWASTVNEKRKKYPIIACFSPLLRLLIWLKKLHGLFSLRWALNLVERVSLFSLTDFSFAWFSVSRVVLFFYFGEPAFRRNLFRSHLRKRVTSVCCLSFYFGGLLFSGPIKPRQSSETESKCRIYLKRERKRGKSLLIYVTQWFLKKEKENTSLKSNNRSRASPNQTFDAKLRNVIIW